MLDRIERTCLVGRFRTERLRMSAKSLIGFVTAAWFGCVLQAHGQWLSQTNSLKPGWNAVFLHVDPGHATINSLVGSDPSNPIIEIWRWNPPLTTQFADSPQNPNPGSEWSSWVRTQPASALQRLQGDAAYLVRVGTNVTGYSWIVKGRPVPPRHQWTVTGVNFLGFPTVPANPPKFDSFLAVSPELATVVPEIYYYPGGELGPGNPVALPQALFRGFTVNRGQAYWVRAESVFNHYFGPFEVVMNGTGVDFGDSLSAASLRLRNLTTNSLTISLALTGSEAPPAGQVNFAGVPPLILRDQLNVTNLVYGYKTLPVGTPRSWTLSPAGGPGSEIEVVIGLNRSALSTPPGVLLSGILRFSDSLGFTRIDVGVSATAASSAGLWVGSAVVNQVGQYIKQYERDSANNPVAGEDGSYAVTNIDTTVNGVPRPYPLRLIVHNPASGNAALLQRVFVGFDSNTNTILALKETALSPMFLDSARRLSAVHLPWSAANLPWSFNGSFATSTNLTTRVTVGYNDRASSPFVHEYHPDHDNLGVTFKNLLPQGSESYTIQRDITLAVTPPENNFSSLVSANRTVNGTYSEVITLLGLARAGGTNHTRRFEVRGDFTLNRVSSIAQITPAP